MKDIKNKHVIRKENKKGGFTTVKYTILRDKSLTSNAKILMIEILSDADRFDFSESLYMKRMGIGKKAYRAALQKLVDSRYIRKKEIKHKNRKFHYTISEYGNLKEKDITTEEQGEESNSQPETRTVDVPPTVELNKKQTDELGNLMVIFKDFLTMDIAVSYSNMMDTDIDFYGIKSELVKLVEKEKKSYFKKIANEIELSSSNRDKKDEAIKLVRKEVFENNKKLGSDRAQTRASENINRRKPLDPESLAADRADGI